MELMKSENQSGRKQSDKTIVCSSQQGAKKLRRLKYGSGGSRVAAQRADKGFNFLLLHLKRAINDFKLGGNDVLQFFAKQREGWWDG